jgi:hypothetical protein
MDKLKEMFERLPKWAKIGLPIIAAVLVVYVIYKNKGTTSGTLQEATVGSADTSGSSGGTPSDGGGSTDPGLPSTVVDKTPTGPPIGDVVLPSIVAPAANTSQKHTPEKAQPAEIALAAHWAAQAAKNAKKAGVKAPATAKADSSMTEAQAVADYQRNKGIAEGLAAKGAKHTTTSHATVATKSRTVPVSHVVAPKKESPKKGAPTVTHPALKTVPKKGAK